MLTQAPVRHPREFADRPDDSPDDFLDCFGRSLANGRDPTTILSKTQIIADFVRDDIGVTAMREFVTIQRSVLLEVLNTESVMKPYWIGTWEGLLKCSFPGAAAVDEVKKVKERAKARFYQAEQQPMSANIISKEKVENIVWTYEMFPLIKTVNPIANAITNPEFDYARQVIRNTLLATFEDPHIDQDMRDIIGGKVEKLFPKLPDRGWDKKRNCCNVKGEDRSFASSLRWTFSNPRKEMNRVSNSLVTRWLLVSYSLVTILKPRCLEPRCLCFAEQRTGSGGKEGGRAAKRPERQDDQHD